MLLFARSSPRILGRAASASTSKPRSYRAIATMAQKQISVDIVSDSVCPWCYVGKRRLEAAIRAFKGRPEGKDVDFHVTWKPFQLNPDAPQDDPGREKMEVYNEKFGESRTAQMVPMMTETFANVGLSYSMAGKTGSTLNSHRLIWWALQKGGPPAQDRVVEALFKAYFTQEKYVNDPAILLEAAVVAGLDKEEATAFIADSEAGKAEVTKELRDARLRAISGVPNFTIGGQHVLSGAQESATFEQVFRRVVAA